VFTVVNKNIIEVRAHLHEVKKKGKIFFKQRPQTRLNEVIRAGKKMRSI
jgi:hypothetical protein